MLYIMRHGRTVWNMEHKLQGKTDVPLSEAGRPVVCLLYTSDAADE